MENVIIQQPHPFDLIDNTVMISGVETGIEGTLSLSIGDGYYKIKDYIQLGDKTIKNLQAKVTIPSNIKLDRVSLIASNDNSSKTVIIPLFYTPNIINDYSNFWLHKVDENETLSTIALKYYNDENKWGLIYRSNIDRISNPKEIYPGQILRIPREES